MRELEIETTKLFPTEPLLFLENKHYELVLSLIDSFKAGRYVEPIRIIKHPSEGGYIILDGNSRSFSAYKACVNIKALLIEDEEDLSQLGKVESILECLKRCLDSVEITRGSLINCVADYDTQLKRFLEERGS